MTILFNIKFIQMGTKKTKKRAMSDVDPKDVWDVVKTIGKIIRDWKK